MQPLPAARCPKSAFLVLPSLALALAPKCPACLLAWAGVAGSMSATAVYGAWLAPVTAASLALAVAALAARARRVRRYGPVWAALLAATAIFAGRFTLHQKAFVVAGMAALAAAALWSSRPAAACGCHSERTT